MPSSPKAGTISLRTTLTEKMKVKHEQELKRRPSRTNQDFGGYVNDILEDILEKDEFLKIYAPSITALDVNDDILYLKDQHIKDRFVEIILRDSQIYCRYHKSFDCVHVRYAFAIPEVARLNLRAIK